MTMVILNSNAKENHNLFTLKTLLTLYFAQMFARKLLGCIRRISHSLKYTLLSLIITIEMRQIILGTKYVLSQIGTRGLTIPGP